MKILFVASELTPIAKVGGLGDVVGSLPKALEKLGVEVKIVIGKYGTIEEKKWGLKKQFEMAVPWGDGQENVGIWQTKLPQSQVDVYFADHPFIGGAGVYDSPTAFAEGDHEVKRFLMLSRAALELCKKINWQPATIHLHDWHTSLIPVWLKTVYKNDPFLGGVPTLLTIHNLANQGVTSRSILEIAGLQENELTSIKDDLVDGDLNLFRQGIENADLLNVVSPTYAKEILTPTFGEGLEKILQARGDDLSGILNGIDVEQFNPATDPDIIQNYDIRTLDKKLKNKTALQKELGLPIDGKIPLLGLISRLTDQKGGDLVDKIIGKIVKLGVQFVVLGVGDPVHEKYYTNAAKKYPQNVSANIRFDAVLAQKIYAGADMFLMPSRFEPCGLGQMIAMRYGTVPIVRKTGGLADTVREGRVGFVFVRYEPEVLFAAINRAVTLYKNSYPRFLKLARAGMEKDFSWRKSAKEYVKLYERLKK